MKWILFGVLAGLTFQRCLLWQTSRSLWEATEAGSPCLARPHANLAKTYEDLGLSAAALNEWHRVVEIALDGRCPSGEIH